LPCAQPELPDRSAARCSRDCVRLRRAILADRAHCAAAARGSGPTSPARRPPPRARPRAGSSPASGRSGHGSAGRPRPSDPRRCPRLDSVSTNPGDTSSTDSDARKPEESALVDDRNDSRKEPQLPTPRAVQRSETRDDLALQLGPGEGSSERPQARCHLRGSAHRIRRPGGTDLPGHAALASGDPRDPSWATPRGCDSFW
jgi:hypothetical protein